MSDNSLDQNRASEALDGIVDLAYRLLGVKRPKELWLKAGGTMFLTEEQTGTCLSA